MDDKIKKQVEEQPLAKEESKAQFIKITELLGLKHSFNFDEAWEIGLEIKQRKTVNVCFSLRKLFTFKEIWRNRII